MSGIEQKIVYCVGDFTFDTQADAEAHVRRVNARKDLVLLLETAAYRWRVAPSDEIADFVIDNFEAIKTIIENPQS